MDEDALQDGSPPTVSEASGSPEKPANPPEDLDPSQVRMNRWFLAGGLVLIALAFFSIIRVFVVPIILAATFTTLLYPCYRRILARLGSRRGISAFICCLLFLLGLLIPVSLMTHLLAGQAIDLYTTAEPKVRAIIQKGDQGALGRIRDSRLGQMLSIDQIDWLSVLQEGLKATGKLVTKVIDKTSRGVFELVTTVLITLFTMFYFFRDGPAMVQRIAYLSPLNREYEGELFSRFVLISRTLLIGITQGGLGGLTFMLCGIHTWMLWGAVMMILSIIPLVGAWVVMVPAAIIELILGNVWQAIVILTVSTVVISNIDNLMRPALVGRDARMHDLLIFFSTLGGIAVFGIMGFIIGPVIAALFVTLLDIYGREFSRELSSPRTRPDP